MKSSLKALIYFANETDPPKKMYFIKYVPYEHEINITNVSQNQMKTWNIDNSPWKQMQTMLQGRERQLGKHYLS